MEDRIGIQPEIVRGIKTRIGTNKAAIEDIIGNLTTLNAELETAWDGSAQHAFETSYGKWISDLKEYVGTLESVQGYLESVVANYEELNLAAQQAASNAAAAM